MTSMIEEKFETGSIVRIRHDSSRAWPEVVHQVGMIVKMAKRLYIPAAKVMVMGEIAEFDLEELELVEKREK